MKWLIQNVRKISIKMILLLISVNVLHYHECSRIYHFPMHLLMFLISDFVSITALTLRSFTFLQIFLMILSKVALIIQSRNLHIIFFHISIVSESYLTLFMIFIHCLPLIQTDIHYFSIHYTTSIYL